ncbi:MAG: galactose mutarotase [Solirubrobacterales bacterium]|nr:galactose mutarotase [Solirubrobacterales bacterium]
MGTIETGGRLRRRTGLAVVAATFAALWLLAPGGGQAWAASASAGDSLVGSQAGLSVSKQLVGDTTEPYTGMDTPVYQYTLSDAAGMSVQILTYGAIIHAIDVPDRLGQPADVVLGFNSLGDYVANNSPPVTANGGPYFGEVLGRYANRLAAGKFTLDQPGAGPVTYTLPVNDGTSSLNGGLVGFGNHVWADQEVQGPGYVGVQLTLNSPSGDEGGPAGSPGCPNGCTGYPASLQVVVTYTLNDQNELSVSYQATNQSPNLNTIVNLTNASYFNLAGENAPAGSAYGQEVAINGADYTPIDGNQIPLGQEASVLGTPLDFTTPQSIGSRIDDFGANFNAPGNQLAFAHGYDFNWALNPRTPGTTGPGGLNLAARAIDPGSGRELSVWTDQPGVQFDTANLLNGTLTGISGDTYRQGAGYAFETQHFPDSPNESSFPSTILDAHQSLSTTTVYQFSAPSLSVSAPATGTAATAIAPGSIGATLSDATSNASGAITYTVFGPQPSAPTNCTTGGTPVGTATVSGSGAYQPSGGYVPPSAGTYYWYASYSGDAGNQPATSGCGAGMTSTVVSASAPVHAITLSRLSLSAHKISVAGRKVGGRCVTPTPKNTTDKQCRLPIHLAVAYRLSAGGSVTFTVHREVAGRKVNRSCVAPTRKNKRDKQCTRLIKLHGRLIKVGKAGANRFVWNGAIGGRELGPGTYEITATPAGGSPQAATFTIVG